VKQGRSRRATASLSSARSRLSLFGGRLAAPAPLSALAPACAARRAGSAPTAAGSAAAAAPGPPAASAGPPPAPAAGGCLRPGGGFAAAAGLSPAPSALPWLVRGRASATAAGWGAAAAGTAAAAPGRARGCVLRRKRVQARPVWPVLALRVTSRSTGVPDPRAVLSASIGTGRCSKLMKAPGGECGPLLTCKAAGAGGVRACMHTYVFARSCRPPHSL